MRRIIVNGRVDAAIVNGRVDAAIVNGRVDAAIVNGRVDAAHLPASGCRSAARRHGRRPLLRV